MPNACKISTDPFDSSTVIVIAHKLQSIRNADCIFVIAGGKLVEEGTHNNLVERRGQYYELIKSQL
jgi:ABC-type multidrug transport system fused ATPase/permease subunit